jgi:predicted permease
MSDWHRKIRERLAGLHLSPEREAEIVEELSSHLQDRYEELLRAGASEESACRSVLGEIEDSGLLRDLRAVEVETAAQTPFALGAAGSRGWLADFWQDLRFGARMLAKAPSVTAIAVLTLAVGIGANTAAFTIINTLLVNPLPVDRAAELVALQTKLERGTEERQLQPVSFLNLKEYRDENRVFSNLAGYSETLAVTMAEKGSARRVFVEAVTGNYFETLSLRPVLGRFFSQQEDTIPGKDAVAVIGYAAWRGLFGGSPDVLGRVIDLNGTAFTIIGVAPKGFLGVHAIFGPDLWVPSMMAASVMPSEQENALTDRALLAFVGVGRLKKGVTRKKAQADLRTIAAGLAKEYPQPNEGQSVALEPLNELALETQGNMGTLGGMLLACSNVANLLFARGAARRQEVAVRLALGAARGRLVRQLLTESLLTCLLGGATGLAFGYAGCRFLWSFRPPEFARNLADLKLGGNVFLFALVAALLAVLLSGIAPALRSSRVGLVEALKEEPRTAGPSRRRVTTSNVLLVGQVAGSLVLLVVAALFLGSLRSEYTIRPGFQTNHLALFLLYPDQAGYDRTRTEQFYRQARERLAALPGIASVSWASNLPFWAQPEAGIAIEGRETRRKSESIVSVVNTIDLDYFSTLGIPLVEGRGFTESDGEGSVPVAVINDTMAARYWPSQDPIGRRIKLPGENGFRTIVGVARTVDYQTLGEAPESCIYIPLRQNYRGSMVLYIRTERDPQLIVAPARTALHSLDPGLPVEDARTGAKVIDQAIWSTKMAVGLLSVFGLLALCLASVGLYGVMAYSVTQRRREVGIRVALGATGASVERLILAQGMKLVAWGIALGIVVSVLAGLALSRFLHGVGATDIPELVLVSIVLLTVAFVACYVPARAASRLDPLVTLREG